MRVRINRILVRGVSGSWATLLIQSENVDWPSSSSALFIKGARSAALEHSAFGYTEMHSPLELEGPGSVSDIVIDETPSRHKPHECLLCGQY